MRVLLRIGALSGLAAGVALAVFLATFGRGPIRDALAIEESQSHGSAAHEELFSRGVQEIGGALGLLVFGLALGVIFAIVLGAVARHLPGPSPMAAAVQFGVIGFIAVVLVPFLKYPGNPPAVGNPDTINERTILYFLALILSIALVILIFQVRRRVSGHSVPTAWLTAGVYALGLGVVFLGLPASPDDVTISADLVWRFRLTSLASNAAGWTAMTLVAGTLFTRIDTQSRTGE